MASGSAPRPMRASHRPLTTDHAAAAPQKKADGEEDEPAPEVEEVKKKVKTKGGKKAAADEAEAGVEEEVPWLERP